MQIHPLSWTIKSVLPGGFRIFQPPVQARPKDGYETPRVSSLRSSTWRERVSQWKLAREKVLCGSRNQSHDAKECCALKEVKFGELEMDNELRQPLSRKLKIPSSIINPYRVLILLRLVILIFYVQDRLLNPVKKAYGLWLTSVICEIWFALSWVLEHLPRWCPVDRETWPERLCLRYNSLGKESHLACIDIFVCTVDPVKEPPIVIANTLLSILSVDYPAEKVACYVSDDGASLSTHQTLLETSEFARKWVPFCKKYSIEPRSPECYFSQKVDYLECNSVPSFAKERRAMKRQYEEFKVHINDLVAQFKNVPSDGWTMKDGTPWPGNNTENHPAMIQVLMGPGGQNGYDKELPQLVYVSREKCPAFQHNRKAGALNALVRVSAILTNGAYILNLDCNHYINNSKALLEAMCFMMDHDAREKICYVQFPQRFDGLDAKGRYSSPNTVFYDISLKCLDGIQGPMYIGTGCVFNRKALYGWDPPFGRIRRKEHPSNCAYLEEHKSLLNTTEPTSLEREFPATFQSLEKFFGQSTFLLASTLVKDNRYSRSASCDELLKQAIHVLSCDYEENTAWGREIGWIYGTSMMDIIVGFRMHARGWRSIYCMPSVPAFRGSAPINLSDRLHQLLCWATGSVEVLLSRQSPIWYGYGGKLKLLQRIAYINATIYPLTSIPLVIYCTLPAVCLLTGKFITPVVSYATSIWLPLFIGATLATRAVEVKWSGVSLREWWRHQQFWVVAGVSSHFFAFFQGLLISITKKYSNSATRAKNFPDNAARLEFLAFKWTPLLIMPATLIFINLLAMVAGVSVALKNGYLSWETLFSKLFFSSFIVMHLYPFLEGLLVCKNHIPTAITIWSLILASLFSLLWLRANPFVTVYQGPDQEHCGINC
ncbi:probable cellulose synthase A catalytic subunit 8 [UDP-forming] isoform X2 [Aristolochia californica]|uniref:probable cellulose synthase A catalytic subunit 8 [UDP-forming] isoform X2 n=1 Tax=Aristolochia californica TaxID=171875 RepID=UPI0035E29FE6